MKIKTLKYLLRHPFGDRDYGFIAIGDMPEGEYSAGNIPYSGTGWAITADFKRMAKNHCAAVAAMNLALYFACAGHPELVKATYKDTFRAVHGFVGNGPVFRLISRAGRYFSDCGCKLSYRPVKDFGGLKAAVKNGHPCVLLLADGLFQWHWVVAAGYREYGAGVGFVRLANGWQRRADWFYAPNSGSVVLAAAEVWV